MASRGRSDSRSSIAVIIPCLNEADFIRTTLESVAAQADPLEIIVSDGGSTDATREIASKYGRVVETRRGRASQMNAGAAEAQSDILLFLHADTVLPDHAFDAIRRTLRNSAVEAGAFRLQFDRPTPLLRFYSFCTRFGIPRLCFGDRGLFVRREVFRAVGGFPSVPMFEDLELVHILVERGGFEFLEERVTTSARRFHRSGPLRQQLRNGYLWIGYLIGSDPRRLTHLYPYRSQG